MTPLEGGTLGALLMAIIWAIWGWFHHDRVNKKKSPYEK